VIYNPHRDTAFTFGIGVLRFCATEVDTRSPFRNGDLLLLGGALSVLSDPFSIRPVTGREPVDGRGRRGGVRYSTIPLRIPLGILFDSLRRRKSLITAEYL